MTALIRDRFKILRVGAIAGALLTASAATVSAAPISYTPPLLACRAARPATSICHTQRPR